jgi:hypothetical protein
MRNFISGLFMALCLGSLSSQHQTYQIPNLPVAFDYPEGWELHQTGKRAWVITDKTTEFNVILYRAHPRFTLDSLRYMAMELYSDPSIQNIQVTEVRSGRIGQVDADKVLLSFTAGGKMYISTIYLAKIHFNHLYNSILFYFEIGESNLTAYTPIQDFMISSLRYLPFVYEDYSMEGVNFMYPSHWATKRIRDDSTFAFFSDDLGVITLYKVPYNDTLSLSVTMDAYREWLKKHPGDKRELKIKSNREKITLGNVYLLEMVYMGNWNGITMKMIQRNHYFISRNENGKLTLWNAEIQYPENRSTFYEPVMKKWLNSIAISGVTEY